MDIYEFVEMISARPGMYVESQSATELDYFLRGFATAKKLVSCEPSDLQAYYDFNRWVCEKTGISANVSWRRAVAFEEPNEYFAFQRFFELWAEFTLNSVHTKT